MSFNWLDCALWTAPKKSYDQPIFQVQKFQYWLQLLKGCHESGILEAFFLFWGSQKVLRKILTQLSSTIWMSLHVNSFSPRVLQGVCFKAKTAWKFWGFSLPSLKHSPWTLMVGFTKSFPFWRPATFSGAMAVSFRRDKGVMSPVMMVEKPTPRAPRVASESERYDLRVKGAGCSYHKISGNFHWSSATSCHGNFGRGNPQIDLH